MTLNSRWLTILMAGVLILPIAAEPDNRKRTYRDAEVTLRLVEASASAQRVGQDASGLVPAELKGLLRFQHYRLLDFGYLRGRQEETLSIALAVNMFGRIKFRVLEDEPTTLWFDVSIMGAPNGEGKRPTLLETEGNTKSG